MTTTERSQATSTSACLDYILTARIDYCNTLLAGAPQYQHNRLQAVMNSAGRLICGLSKFDHISHVLHDRLHWLTVPQWVWYKLCLLMYKAYHGLALQYLTDLCQPVSLVSGRSRLQSSIGGDLIVISTSSNFRWWSFAVSTPAAWNQLPPDIRNLQTLESFKSRLKTHLFNCNWHDNASLYFVVHWQLFPL